MDPLQLTARNTDVWKRLLALLSSLLVPGSAPAAETMPPPQAADWLLGVPIQRMATGEPPRIIDLAAHDAAVVKVEAIHTLGAPWEGPVRGEVVASPVDQRPTAVRLMLDHDAPGTEPVRQALRIDVAHRGGGGRAHVIFIDYEPRPVVAFAVRPQAPLPHQVYAAGSFNGWNATADPLHGPDEEGYYRLERPLAPGRYLYKFVINGNWQPDPENPNREPDGFGGHNSVIEVEGPGRRAAGTLWPAPNAAAEAAFHYEGGGVPVHAVLVGGNQLLAIWWRGSGPDADRPVRMTVEGARIDLNALAAADAFAPDGVLRLMLRADNGSWTDVVLTRPPAERMRPEWRGRTIYFALTDRFADGDPTNNRPIHHPELKPAANYHGGDWIGLRRKIEEGYFDQLGIGVLWISAPNRQPEVAEVESVPPGNLFTGYHGYWPVSPTETNPHFGTHEDLRALVAAAHERGILVLIDLVTNHVHEDHPWYREHPEWFGELMLPDGEANIRRFDEHPFTTWFDTFLPAFDFSRPGAIEAVTRNAVWWLERSGADGFRQDAVKHVPRDLWRAMTRRLRDEIELKRGRRTYQVGETISDRGTIFSFVSAEMLDGQFDFPTYWPLREALAAHTRGLDDLAREIQASQRVYGEATLMAPIIGNHDVSRFMAFAGGAMTPEDAAAERTIGWRGDLQIEDPTGYARLRMAHALLFALPGLPMLYYGDEIGLTGAGDPDNRRPMRFEAQWSEAERATHEWAARVGWQRHQSAALRYGALRILAAAPEHMALARVCTGRRDRGTADEAVIVALSRRPGRQTLTVPLPPGLRGFSAWEPIATMDDAATARVEGRTLRIDLAGPAAVWLRAASPGGPDVAG